MGHGIDGAQLSRTLLLEGVQPRVLQGHGCLSGKQRQQINGLAVEVVGLVALAIQHTHHFIADHQRNCQLRPSSGNRAYVSRVFADVWHIDGLFLERRDAADAFSDLDTLPQLRAVASDLRAQTQLLRLLVEQPDGHVVETEEIARDGQNPLQHLVQVERGQDCLAGVIEHGNSRH